MKPITEKTYVDQALKNRKGITWLDSCRIPYESDHTSGWESTKRQKSSGGILNSIEDWLDPFVKSPQGRFPANLLVSDDVLNDGRVIKPSFRKGNRASNKNTEWMVGREKRDASNQGYNDSGSFSRYFDLNKWYKQLKIKR